MDSERESVFAAHTSCFLTGCKPGPTSAACSFPARTLTAEKELRADQLFVFLIFDLVLFLMPSLYFSTLPTSFANYPWHPRHFLIPFTKQERTSTDIVPIDKLALNFISKGRGTRIAKTALKKKTEVGGIILLKFKRKIKQQ